MGINDDQTYANIMKRASEIVGGTEALCMRIGATAAECQSWMQGDSRPPAKVFGKVVDVLVEHVGGKSARR
jgi:hypothetical protein